MSSNIVDETIVESSANNVSCNPVESDKLPAIKITKPLLAKRAVPFLPKKRPAPKLLPSSKERPVLVETLDSKCDDSVNSLNEPQQKLFKLEDNARVETSLEPTKTNIDVKKSEDTIPSPFQVKDETCKENSSTKENTDKLITQRFIKKRVAPKLGKLVPKEVPKTSNESADKSLHLSKVSLQLEVNKSPVKQDFSAEIQSSPSKESINEGICEPQSKLSPKAKPVGGNPIKSNDVLNVLLNVPLNSLDKVEEDLLLKEKLQPKLVDVKNSSVKKHGVVYCNLKPVTDSKEVSENWVCVNFNQPNNHKFDTSKDEDGNANKVDSISSTQTSQDNCNLEKSEGVVNVCLESSVTSKVLSLEVLKTDANLSINDKPDVDCSVSNLVKSPEHISNSEKLCNEHSKSVIKTKSKDLKNPGSKAIELGECLEKNTQAQLGKKASGKPYTLREKKPVKQEASQEEFDDEKVEDIFSNSEDSDGSEFSPEPEEKIKVPSTVKSKPTGKKNLIRKEKGQKLKHQKKTDCDSKDTKSKVKVEKRTKKIPDNPSAFTKLSLELKNKNKWDDDGNCAEPDKLELKDYIFFVPKNDPMSQESKKEIKLNTDEAEETVEEDKSDPEEDESHGPKLIVKDGKIMVDPNSTRIKQTPVVHPKIEKFEKPKEPNDPWNLQDTMRFYATLWKYGIDYSMLAGTFPKKSRDSIKKKFNYEEKNNNILLSKTLTKKLDIRAILRELVLIDRLMMVAYKKSSDKKCPKQPRKNNNTRHCLLPKKKKNSTRKRNYENSVSSSQLSSQNQEDSNQSALSLASENSMNSEAVQSINLNDLITFSTNVVYKDMNIVESVSFHPSAIQPIDVNVTIRHD